MRRGRKVVFSRELYLWALGVCLAGGGLGKASSERPERHSEVVRTGVASGAGVPPSALTPREGWGVVADFRPDPGLSGPAFGGQPLPRLACPEGDLPPARRRGLALLSVALDSGPEGSPLPSCPACPFFVLGRTWPGTTNASLPFRLAPGPGSDSSDFLLALAEVSARGGACFPERSQSIYIPSLLGGDRQTVVFFGPLPANPP